MGVLPERSPILLRKNSTENRTEKYRTILDIRPWLRINELTVSGGRAQLSHEGKGHQTNRFESGMAILAVHNGGLRGFGIGRGLRVRLLFSGIARWKSKNYGA